jgi:hypothetical protein
MISDATHYCHQSEDTHASACKTRDAGANVMTYSLHESHIRAGKRVLAIGLTDNAHTPVHDSLKSQDKGLSYYFLFMQS